MAHTPQSPVVVNVADFLKQIQQNRPPAQNVIIGGQGPATQHNSVNLLGGASTLVTTSQGSINYSYKVKDHQSGEKERCHGTTYEQLHRQV